MPAAKPGRARLAIAAGVVVASAAAIALGPGAAWIVDTAADGRQVWRLGRVEIDGVRGAWIGDLRADRLSIADNDGVWLEARDLSLAWRPFELLLGNLHLESAAARQLSVVRKPNLSAATPPGRGSLDVELDSLAIETTEIAPAVFGEGGRFRAALALELSDKQVARLDLALHRLDSDADRADISYRRDFALRADIAGASGGVFAHALGAPELAVVATASGEGDAQRGAWRMNASLGAQEVLSGRARWDAEIWSLQQTQAQLSRLPGMATLARRIGDNARLSAEGRRAGRFQADASTDFIVLTLTGATTEDFELDGAADFVATTDALSDIAREAPFSFGPARLQGQVRWERNITALRAQLEAGELEVFGRRAALSGPIEASLTPTAFELKSELAAPQDSPALFANARLRTELEYNREQRRFALKSAELVSDAVRIDARGWVNRGEGEFAGEWRARRLNTLFAPLSGQAGGAWRATSVREGDARIWVTSVGGAGDGVSSRQAYLAQLFGARPQIDLRLRNERGGITVEQARLDGAQLRAGAAGRIVGGVAELSLEASARGPLDFGEAQAQGALDATGALRGRLARPTLSARATMTSLNVGAAIIAQPIVTLTLAPAPRRYSGRIELAGAVSGRALAATSELELAGGEVRLPSLAANIGALSTQGSASLGVDGVRAELAFSGAVDGIVAGAFGRVSGNLSYAPEALRVDAQIADARVGLLRIRAAHVRLAGPRESIAAEYELNGRLNEAPLHIAGAGAISAGSPNVTLALNGQGTLAGTNFSTRDPIRARFGDAASEVGFDVALGSGRVAAQWSERGRALAGSAQVEKAPLAPLAAIWGERALGEASGDISLSSEGGGLSGGANIALNEARFIGRQRGALNMRIQAALTPQRATAEIDATSSDGLVAQFEADAPVITSAVPIRIALAPERQGRARWSVNGPAESLWAAMRLQDQDLSGDLNGAGELQFGAGALSGDGVIEIANGRFEDKATAVSLVDLNARVAIGSRGVSIERFEAAGATGGSIIASGGSASPREGRVTLRVRDLRILSRPDARARASGELNLTWEGLRSTLSGALEIHEAEIDAAVSPSAGIPTIDVVEINRPDIDEFGEPPAPAPRNGSTALDVRVRAPARVFTRGRGIDAEWSLDLRLAGAAHAPQVYGQATAIRGTLALSGQPFSIESAAIYFDGDPLDARIDLSAQRDTANLSARIRLTGTARDPEISFSSEPALPEDEILPQVLFGRSVEDLSPFEAAQLAASLAQLSGNASLDLVDAARAAAGLDRFNVRQDENGGFLVAGGIYLTRNVYVEVARNGVGEAQTQVEWTLRPRLVLITSFLGNRDQRVSLRWRRESD